MHGKPENAANRTGESLIRGRCFVVSLGILRSSWGNFAFSLGIYTLSLLGKGARYTLSYQILIPHLLKISSVIQHYNTRPIDEKRSNKQEL